MNNLPILSVLIWLPILSGLIIALTPKLSPGLAQRAGMAIGIITFGLSGFVVSVCLKGDSEFLFRQDMRWLSSIGANYSIGVDCMAAWMILLSSFLGLIAMLISKPTERSQAYFGLLLCLQGTLFGIFSSLDLLLFYMFFEISLVPVALLIMGWGSGDRGKVALRYVAVLFAGSLLMLVGMAILGSQSLKASNELTFSLHKLQRMASNGTLWFGSSWLQNVAFWGFMVAFLVKSPAVPIHRWLNDTYEDAPIGAVVAGVVLKVGTFGMFRFCLPLFPEACKHFAPVIVGIGVVGIVYGGMLAAVQKTPARVMGFSTISHVGFILVGLFSLNHYGMMGAAFQQFNHGIAAAAVFVLLSFLYSRSPGRTLNDFGGLKKSMPVFSTLFLVAMLTNLGLPFTGGFIGEFLALVGIFVAGHGGVNGLTVGFAYVAGFGAILSAVYMLYMYQRLFFGRNKSTEQFKDLDLRETLIGGVFAVIILILGILPMTVLRSMEPRIELLSESMQGSPALANPQTGSEKLP